MYVVVFQVKLQIICTEAANMTDERLFQKDFRSMSALGRNFKVGDMYNYHNDQILPSGINIVSKLHFTYSLFSLSSVISTLVLIHLGNILNLIYFYYRCKDGLETNHISCHTCNL